MENLHYVTQEYIRSEGKWRSFARFKSAYEAIERAEKENKQYYFRVIDEKDIHGNVIYSTVPRGFKSNKFIAL